MITAKKIRKAMKRLKKVEPASAHVNMDAATIFMGSSLNGDFVEECGTVACHAGFYALAKKRNKSGYNWSEGYFIGRLGYRVEYTEGADLLAEDLGMRHAEHLRTWAHKNPKVWGNEYGLNMFHSQLAFGERVMLFKLRTVIDHWLAVADRLQKVEEGKEI